MASSLFNLLSDLAKNAELLDNFKKNPGAVMDQYGLTQDQQALINSAVKDNKQHDFLKAVGDEAHAHYSDGVNPNFAC